MFERILVPVDGSDVSGRAVDLAADLASRYGSEVVVFHVRTLDALYGAWAEVDEEAAELVDGYVRRCKDVGVNVRGEAVADVHGAVAREIVEAATREGVGLVVMGTRGLTSWDRMLIGSVTNRVLHRSRVPVLTVP